MTAGEHLTHVSKQQQGNFEFAAREVRNNTLAFDLAPLRIDAERWHEYRFILRQAVTGTAAHRIDTRQEFPIARRLDQKVVGPGLESLDNVLLGVAMCTYVASEVGVSSWLVRFLEPAPLSVCQRAKMWGRKR